LVSSHSAGSMVACYPHTPYMINPRAASSAEGGAIWPGKHRQRTPGGSVTEHLIHRAITAPDSPRDEAHRASRYPERPWPRTCVWNAAGWRPARAGRTFLGGIRRSVAVLCQAAGLGRAARICRSASARPPVQASPLTAGFQTGQCSQHFCYRSLAFC
jgi:hypothetical protein